MKNKDWQNVFGHAPEQFLDQVDEALNRLKEEKDMKKRYKVSTVLIAAALAVLMTGAAVAAGMGLTDWINQSGDYKMNEQAEGLIAKNLGGMENEFCSAVVEEALFDGQSVFLQILFRPREPEKYALYCVEYPISEGTKEWENFIFEEGAWLPYACKDGRKPLLYDVGVNQVRGSEMGDNSPYKLTAPQYTEDGGVRLLIGSTANQPIRRDTIYLSVTCRWGVAGEYEQPAYESERGPFLPAFEDFRIEIENTSGREKFTLEPEKEGTNGKLQFVSGMIEYTSIGGYYDVEYIYSGEEEWLNEFMWETDGKPLYKAHADIHGADGVFADGVRTVRVQGMIERTEEIPKTLTLILTNRMYEGELGRIGLKVVPAE